jgi:hypothetical protein
LTVTTFSQGIIASLTAAVVLGSGHRMFIFRGVFGRQSSPRPYLLRESLNLWVVTERLRRIKDLILSSWQSLLLCLVSELYISSYH